jgi:hypothetical protein
MILKKLFVVDIRFVEGRMLREGPKGNNAKFLVGIRLSTVSVRAKISRYCRHQENRNLSGDFWFI